MRPILLLLPIVGGSLAATIPTFHGSGNTLQVLLNGQIIDFSPSEMEGFRLNLNEERLVQMEGKEPVLMTELEKIEAKANGIKFFDITDTPYLDAFSRLRTQGTISYASPRLYEQVTEVIQTLSTAGPRENLEKFTSFYTRARFVTLWHCAVLVLMDERADWKTESTMVIVESETDENASPSLRPHITIEEFEHYMGPEYHCKEINGSSQTDDRIVIIGAHQDRHVVCLRDIMNDAQPYYNSTNFWYFQRAPGADDDGSGTVTILESYRSLLASGFVPERPVEFHWYSAEEGGLLGSQAVAQAYAEQGLEVYAMSQFDMTAWVREGTNEEVGVIVDYVDGR
ncbi:hypothetical protein JVT61DRAFT_4227 [Boletus reticuloceps]|uniref:Peptide hydrolase n=1 Tax=Boletus reticuloceps TaxID=495285 RepID=A0A8I2YQ07_9AGAM|nr:hypothetical protein JVT61DRAFT_4227 [Boletus reticuloceps]